MLKSFWSGLIDLLAPLRCVACDAPRDAQQSAFCPACEPLVDPILACPEIDLEAVYAYGGPVADAVRRLKYEGRSEIAHALGAALGERAAKWQARVDVVTAVPMASAKLRARGYNQSALLAFEVAKQLGVPFRPAWMHRKRTGPGQVGQGRALRLSGIRGAFSASPKVRGKAVLIVDDVRTTGATLHEAKRALCESGAREVLQLVVALADARADARADDRADDRANDRA